jgi:DNA-binding transcriptional ArsR family regulator
MSGNDDHVIDQRLVKAISHPVRSEILEALVVGGEQSPNQIARRLDLAPARVSYHASVLCECEVIELSASRADGGSRERFFRPAATFQSFLELAKAAFGADAFGGGAPQT